MRWVEHAERMEEVRNEYNSLVRKPEEMRIPWAGR
jgi:hypothetical protein